MIDIGKNYLLLQVIQLDVNNDKLVKDANMILETKRNMSEEFQNIIKI
jgi:hypothetical protein